MATLEITANDLPIDAVLDQYYTFLKKLIGGSSERVFLFNTITPFDIYQDTPLYNENVFANHADMVIGTSPMVIGEGGISVNDTFSRYYNDTVRIALRKVETKHLSEVDASKIERKEEKIEAKRTKILELNAALTQQWNSHAASLGLTAGTIEYNFEKINFFTNSGVATEIYNLSQEILLLLSEITDIRESKIPAQYLPLVRVGLVLRSKEYKMYRPFRPQLEKSGEISHMKLMEILARAVSSVGLRDIVEENEQILPFADLSLMYRSAKKGFSISKTHGVLESHDRDWGLSGSGSKFLIFQANANVSYQEQVKSSMQKTEEINVEFKALHDIRINRRDWYDASIFGMDVVKKVLEENPVLARNTRHVITSLVLGRGASLSFKFSEQSAYEKMTDFRASITGKAKIGFISFGLGGQYHSHDFIQTNDATNKTITFADEDTVCRVLSLSFEEVHSIGDEQDFFDAFNYAAEYDTKQSKFVPRTFLSSAERKTLLKEKK